MSCPPEEVFVARVENRLDEDESAALERHLDVCPKCAALMVEIVQLVWPADDPEVARVGPYRLGEKLGEGAMGVVYQAWRMDSGSPVEVALKLLLPGKDGAEASKAHSARLRREAHLLDKLSHPHILPVYEVGQWDGHVYMAMRRIKGQDVASWLEHAPRAWADVLDVFLQAGQGLAAAHKQGLVHRDVKPGNILLGDHGGVWLADFGLARVANQDDWRHELSMESMETLTRTGMILGTPAYMPPEQQLGGVTCPRSDQFSFCAALFLGLYGERPFEGDTYQDYAMRVCAGQIKPCPPDTQVPEALYAVLRRGLAPEVEDRWPSMEGVLEALMEASRSVEASGLAARTNLTASPDAFVGRAEVLGEVLARLSDEVRVLTLLGCAGTGKTRLAREVGHQELAQRGYGRGVFFCDLSEARDAESVLAEVARTLGMMLGGDDPVAQVGAALHGRNDFLLILDNAEQVVDVLQTFLPVWLQAAPRLQLLVTSRHHLGVAGEDVYSLAPLSLPEDDEEWRASEAVQLFIARAKQMRPGFSPEGAVEEVVALVRFLDGLPLALELAAARMRMLSPGKILARLQNQQEQLRDRRRTGRHETLQVALDWSWSLLEPSEQAGWSQLSVFESGFTLEDAESVLALEDADAFDVVESLVEKSLLRAVQEETPEPRFSMLKTVRTYGQTRVEEPEGLRRRFAEHLARYGSREALDALHGHGGMERLRALVCDRANLQAALRYTEALELRLPLLLAQGVIYELRGPFLHGATLFEEALEASAWTPHQRVLLMERMVLCQRLGGQKKEAEALAQQALALAQNYKLRREEGWLHGHLGILAGTSGEPQQMIEAYTKAAQIAHDLKDRHWECVWVGQHGLAWLRLGELDKARDAFSRGLALAQKHGNRRYECIWSCNLGVVYFHRGEFFLAQEAYQRCAALARELEDKRQVATIMVYLASLFKKQGQLREACASFEQALALNLQLGERQLQGFILEGLAVVYLEQGRLAQARQTLALALEVAQTNQNSTQEVTSNINMVEVCLFQGRIQEATLLLESTEALVQDTNHGYARPYLLHGRAMLAMERGEVLEALELMEEAITQARGLSQAHSENIFLSVHGDMLRRAGKVEEAHALLSQVEGQFRRAKAQLPLSKVLCRRALLALACDQRDLALVLLQEAQGIAQAMGTGARSEVGLLLDEVRQQLI